ncbi:ribonuclease toxin immunity protein CdiI [Limnobaculum xujianqingii]
MVIVCEEACFKYVRLACENYLHRHPEYADTVEIC